MLSWTYGKKSTKNKQVSKKYTANKRSTFEVLTPWFHKFFFSYKTFIITRIFMYFQRYLRKIISKWNWKYFDIKRKKKGKKCFTLVIWLKNGFGHIFLDKQKLVYCFLHTLPRNKNDFKSKFRKIEIIAFLYFPVCSATFFDPLQSTKFNVKNLISI